MERKEKNMKRNDIKPLSDERLAEIKKLKQKSYIEIDLLRHIEYQKIVIKELMMDDIKTNQKETKAGLGKEKGKI
jgi:hypothetical protein